jgi:hypothetical protein
MLFLSSGQISKHLILSSELITFLLQLLDLLEQFIALELMPDALSFVFV